MNMVCSLPGFETVRLSAKERLVEQYLKLKTHLEQVEKDVEAWMSNSKTVRKVTKERVLEKLRFDPNTGIFTWKTTHRAGLMAGCTGCERGKFYTRIRIDNELIMAHVLAWIVTYGEQPSFEIDHLNGDGTDNRPANLVKSNRLLNNSNASKRVDAKEHRNITLNGSRYRVMVKYAKSISQLEGLMLSQKP